MPVPQNADPTAKLWHRRSLHPDDVLTIDPHAARRRELFANEKTDEARLAGAG